MNKLKRLNKNKFLQARKKRGFTLIEILIVIVILGSLIGILVGSLSSNKSKIDDGKVKLEMQAESVQIELALSQFQNYFGRYPTEEEGLEVLLDPSLVSSDNVSETPTPFIRKGLLLDPWKNFYAYQIDEETGEYRVFSYGSDGKEGGSGAARDRSFSDN